MNIIHPNVALAATSEIGQFNVIGIRHQRLAVKYSAMSQSARLEGAGQRAVTVGERTVVCNHVTIYEDVFIGEDCFVDDYVRVGAGSRIGDGTMLLYGARIYDNVEIGHDCRVAGFVPGRVSIGDRVTMMGTIAHKYERPLDWLRDEPSAVIEEDVVVGLGSVLVGGITVGAGSYVAAGATLTKSVPPNSMVLNTNEIVPVNEFSRRPRGPRTEGGS